jgi:hypothetical protein
MEVRIFSGDRHIFIWRPPDHFLVAAKYFFLPPPF